MKTTKRKEQFTLAETFFELGMDYEVIEKVTGVTSEELFLNKINMIDFDDEKSNNLVAQSRKKKKNSF